MIKGVSETRNRVERKKFGMLGNVLVRMVMVIVVMPQYIGRGGSDDRGDHGRIGGLRNPR